jgi:glucose/arabinose dehydrogenase
MRKFSIIIVSLPLVSLGLFAVWSARFLPMYRDGLWGLAALFLALGGWLLLRRLQLRYLLLVLPLAALLAQAGINRIWPDLPATGNSIEPVAVAPVPGSPELRPVVLADGPAAVRGQTLYLPDGWQVNIFAADLGEARLLALAPDRTLLVSVPDRGQILALPDRDRDGRADRQLMYADRLPSVHGLALIGGDIWAAETGRLLRLPDADRDLRADRVDVRSSDLPKGGGHWTRSLAAAADGTLFLAAGSSCNACQEADHRRAAIMTFAADGAAGSLYASGLRNSVGLAIHPQTGELWASDNGRDMLGDELPPDEINRIEAGGDYGWPYCYGKRIPDPELGTRQRCAETVPAEVELQAHSAPLGMTFVSAALFDYPADRLLLVAYHGSWNRSVPTGYKLVGIPFRQGRPSGRPFDLVRGWLVGNRVWGRPVAPLLGQDGALYLSDDLQGIIYRFSRS